MVVTSPTVNTSAEAFSGSHTTRNTGSAAAASLSSKAMLPKIHIPPLDAERVELIEKAGGTILPLEPIGAEVYGIDLTRERPKEIVVQALEEEMANRGFIVFKKQKNLSVDDLIEASLWWGGRQMHSTHGVHPATPHGNPHIFRLSNDSEHGILGVGPQWHNDGSFVAGPFSHVGYHMVRVPEKGGGTLFAHQGAAFDALPTKDRQEFWERLSSVNSNSGVVHPCVHGHPISKRKSLWLHLGMTGAVIEKLKGADSFRVLNRAEMKQLFHEYNDILNEGLTEGYTIHYEYADGDCIFIDNYAVSHRASPEAHMPPSQQGLRIMHRSTVKAPADFAPSFGLPQFIDIYGPNPFADDGGDDGGDDDDDQAGVWQRGGIGFRWDDNIHMQN